MPRLRKPRALPEGGTVGLAAPAGPMDPERLAQGEARWEKAGFRLKRRGDLLSRRTYLAGDDARRTAELAALVDDPEVDAIVCVRGGYGCQRILGALDPERFRSAGKPLVGYSDITSLLLWQRRWAGLMGFHGPMLELGDALGEDSFRALVDALTARGPARSVLGGRPGGGGRAAGRLVGGSLSLVTASLGTPWEIDTRGAVLLLEDKAELPYRVDRMVGQLRAAGKLAGLAGLGLGALVDCVDPRYPGLQAEAVVLDAAGALDVPVVTDLPFGHADENRVWPVGARAEIDGDAGTLTILERGVSLR